MEEMRIFSYLWFPPHSQVSRACRCPAGHIISINTVSLSSGDHVSVMMPSVIMSLFQVQMHLTCATPVAHREVT